MIAPFYKLGAFGDEASLLVAFLIGIAFGFTLERAGFGSAKKLVSQFYLDDLAVFKVMFTGIVTAMLGLHFLGWMGVIDLSLLYLTPTHLGTQVLGGLLLGFGFVIGGYCPGTSMVAVATGRIDAMVYVLGVALGVFLGGELTPALAGLDAVGSLGRLTLSQALHLSPGLVVLLVVLMAVGGFAGAEWVERRFAPRGKEA